MSVLEESEIFPVGAVLSPDSRTVQVQGAAVAFSSAPLVACVEVVIPVHLPLCLWQAPLLPSQMGHTGHRPHLPSQDSSSFPAETLRL